jgi:hypothetical protein
MTANINFIKDDSKKEKTGRVGGNLRNSVNQYELTENDIMVPRTVANPNSLSMKINLD